MERGDTGEGRHTELTSVGANEDPLSTVHILMHTHTHSSTHGCLCCPLPGDSALTVWSVARCESRQLLMDFSDTPKGQQGVKETLEKHAAQKTNWSKNVCFPAFSPLASLFCQSRLNNQMKHCSSSSSKICQKTGCSLVRGQITETNRFIKSLHKKCGVYK